MRDKRRLYDMIQLRLLMLFLPALTSGPLQAASLAAASPVEVPGTHGKFDFIKVDEARGRLLACHTGNGSLDVIDEATSKLIKSIPTGNAQGVAVDDKNGRYFVSVSKPPQLVIVDATKLEATGTVSLPGPADVCTYSAAVNRVVVDNDDKPQQWWIDPDAKKIVRTIAYSGAGMEDLAFSDDGTVLVQNLKEANLLAVVDSATGSVINRWPTAPAEKPHGLAVLGGGGVLIAGGNGKLVLLDFRTGKVIASADIAPRVDEIADSISNVYCASGTGVISVRKVSTLSSAGRPLDFGENIPSAAGAHSIAVDRKLRMVWVAFAKGAKGETSYVQAFAEN